MPRSLFPKTLAECIEPVTKPVMKAHGLAGTRLISEWESIVGAKLARRTAVEKLVFPKGKKTGGTLTIAVESGFATELQYMQPVILERLAVYFGYQAISRIVISHSFHPEPEPPKKIRRPAPAGTLPAIAIDAEDGEIKDALESLARALAENRT